jgi:hypothetical protein
MPDRPALVLDPAAAISNPQRHRSWLKHFLLVGECAKGGPEFGTRKATKRRMNSTIHYQGPKVARVSKLQAVAVFGGALVAIAVLSFMVR